MSTTSNRQANQPTASKLIPHTASLWELAMRRLVLGLAAVLPPAALDLVDWWIRTR